MPFVLCNSQELLDSTLSSLEASSVLFLDCEGHSLGDQDGQLSVISLGTGDERGIRQIFLIDVTAFPRTLLKPLFALLQATTPPKIVFDGRNDFSELFHGHNVELNGVLDLQLADIESRPRRGEGDFERVGRFWRYIGPAKIQRARANYKMIQRVAGLKWAAKEHGVATNESSSRMSHDEWMKRPLSQTLLEYAAKDIELIQKLYSQFRQFGYINDARLKEQSQRYLNYHRAKRPSETDPYRQHALLPLGILDQGSGINILCRCCERELSADCFPRMAVQRETERQCWVCRAIRDKGTGVSGR